MSKRMDVNVVTVYHFEVIHLQCLDDMRMNMHSSHASCKHLICSHSAGKDWSLRSTCNLLQQHFHSHTSIPSTLIGRPLVLGQTQSCMSIAEQHLTAAFAPDICPRSRKSAPDAL